MYVLYAIPFGKTLLSHALKFPLLSDKFTATNKSSLTHRKRVPKLKIKLNPDPEVGSLNVRVTRATVELYPFTGKLQRFAVRRLFTDFIRRLFISFPV